MAGPLSYSISSICRCHIQFTKYAFTRSPKGNEPSVWTFRRSENFPICNKKPPPTGPEHRLCLRDDGRNNQRLWMIFFSRKAGAMGRMADVVEAALRNSDPVETNEILRE